MTQLTDGRRARGDLTRRRAARQAALDATVTGLESLSVATLAERTGLSKSGILTVFGTREAILLAAVAEARVIYDEHVLAPARSAAPGAERLRALVGSWHGYALARVFPGGCFITTTSVEFAAQTGVVADAVRALKRSWLDYLAHHARVGELAEPDDVAFRIDAALVAGVTQARLFDDDGALDHAVRAALAAIDG